MFKLSSKCQNTDWHSKFSVNDKTPSSYLWILIARTSMSRTHINSWPKEVETGWHFLFLNYSQSQTPNICEVKRTNLSLQITVRRLWKRIIKWCLRVQYVTYPNSRVMLQIKIPDLSFRKQPLELCLLFCYRPPVCKYVGDSYQFCQMLTLGRINEWSIWSSVRLVLWIDICLKYFDT